MIPVIVIIWFCTQKCCSKLKATIHTLFRQQITMVTQWSDIKVLDSWWVFGGGFKIIKIHQASCRAVLLPFILPFTLLIFGY